MYVKVRPFSSTLYLTVYVTWKGDKIQLPRYSFIREEHLKPGALCDNLSFIALYIACFILYTVNDRAYGEVRGFYFMTLRIGL